jgi:CelD/BcsL family acetyltransferase involved in cellulose biosynthesis
MRNFSRDSQERGRLRLWYLEVDGEPAAIALAVVANSTCYLSSHSYDARWMKQHIADVLLGHCIESAIAEGLHTFDFLSTPAAYKLQYAKQTTMVLKLTLYRPRLRSLCFEALAHISALPVASLRSLRRHPAPTLASDLKADTED